MRQKESSRRQVNDTLQEVFYSDAVIGMLLSNEFTVATREQPAKDSAFEYDDEVALIEEYEYKVEREKNNLRIYKDNVDG